MKGLQLMLLTRYFYIQSHCKTEFSVVCISFISICFLGFLIDYISHPVINSFTTAAAITIAEGQLKVSMRSNKDLLNLFFQRLIYIYIYISLKDIYIYIYII